MQESGEGCKSNAADISIFDKAILSNIEDNIPVHQCSKYQYGQHANEYTVISG